MPPPRILIVEDASTMRAYLERLIAGAGYAVTTAMNGVEGLDAALAEPPDLVLTDLNMPQMDGLAMTAAFRAREEFGPVPIVMLTTEKDAQDVAAAAEAGANFHMPKPPRPERVLTLLRLLTQAEDRP